MHFRRNLTIFLLLFSAVFSVFPQKNMQEQAPKIPVGTALSQHIESLLSKNGFSPLRQELSATGQDTFAYNLLVEFAPTVTESERETDGSDKALGRTEVIFCFTQEDFFRYQTEISDFLTQIQNFEKPFTVFVVFTALDFTDTFEHPVTGTGVFTESLEGSETSCAITVQIDERKETALYTGTYRATAPLWMTQRITSAFFDCQADFSFITSLSSVYSLGLVKTNGKFARFLRAGIPALGISFSNISELAVLRSFASAYTISGTEEWDQHYVYISLGNLIKPFFINERALILSCLIVGIFSILLLCVFSFTGKNGEKNKREFQRSVYLIPITIALSFLSLSLSQYVVAMLSHIVALNPVMQYGIKLTFSMILASLLFTLQEKLKISVAGFVYGYILSVISIFNIFLFSTQDLLLFVAFVAEYVIIYISRSSKRFPVMVVCFIAMMVPFFPYVFTVIKNADDAELRTHVFSSVGGNMLLSFAIFPFQIMWLRILVVINIFFGKRGYTIHRMRFNNFISTLIILVLIFITLGLVVAFVYRPQLRASQKIERKLIDDDMNTLSVKLTKDTFSGMNTNHVSIASKENAFRYTVEVYGIDTPHPIYDSIYTYEIISTDVGTKKSQKKARETDESDIISFVIPEYPPKAITIDYASDMFVKARIVISAWYETPQAQVFRREQRELSVE